MNPSPRPYAALIALLLLATATRLFAIQAQSIWFDEGWSAYAAVQADLAAAANADATNPPLYYALLHGFARFAGHSELALRFFSLLLGLLTIPLAYQLGRRIGGARAAWYGAALVALSPLLGWASHEARMYTLLAVLVLIAALAWHALRVRPSMRWWAALWVAELLLLYAHNTGPVIVLWLNGATLIAWLIGPRRPAFIPWVAGQIGVGLLWLPYFAARFLSLAEANSAIRTAPRVDFALWEALWAGPWSLTGAEPFIAAVALFTIPLLIVGAWWTRGGRWALVHTALLTGGLLLGLALLGNEAHGRYLVMIAPLPLLAIGAGVAHLPARGLRWAALAIFATGFVFALARAQDPAYQHDDVRGMVAHYARTLGPGDSVVAWSYADRYDLWYYWDRLGVTAARITLPEGASREAALPLLPTEGAVALNIWYTQRADYRGMLGCLLEHGADQPPAIFTTYGMSSAHYATAAESVAFATFDLAVMGDGSALAVGVERGTIPPLTADRALCHPVTLRLERPTSAELKAALIARNALGWEIARADAIFATDNQRTTDMLDAGEVVTAYPLLRLPYGAPPGPYELILRIYDEARQPSGYELRADPGAPPVRDWPLGVWDVPAGAAWAAPPPAPDLPVAVDHQPTAGPHLLAHDAREGAVVNGAVVPLTLLWDGVGRPPTLTLMREDGSWRVDFPGGDAVDGVLRDWRALRIPVDAPPGPAVLALDDGLILARWQIETLPLLTEPPPFDLPVGVAIDGVGELVGLVRQGDSFDRSRPVPVTLIWRSAGPIDVSYTVFVQLIDARGQLIAQSDSLPAAGQRPTTGWRAGEYLIDEHSLQFNAAAGPGPARLIVGLYDARTGARVPIAESDHIALPGSVLVR